MKLLRHMQLLRYVLVKGLLEAILGLMKLSYCKKTLNIDGNACQKTLNIDGIACQTMMAVAGTPWAIKGALGVLSDAYPLFGWHKNSYIMMVKSFPDPLPAERFC
ncbi:hypothetical protein T484DRAFT_1851813 [Baffinella frigidus]|nr:hypothetical protein T484DRAFT_1851813 [Cryptophyta sp. CCMP2293]